jgi:hypothetical protein
MNKLLACSILVLWTSGALATGGFECKVTDKNIKFDFGGTTGIAYGSPLVPNTSGELVIKKQDAPIQIPMVKFTLENVKQYWYAGSDLNLMLSWEPNDGGDYAAFVGMTIKTKRKGQLFYGTYTLYTSVNSPMINDLNHGPITKTLKGSIVCEDDTAE